MKAKANEGFEHDATRPARPDLITISLALANAGAD